MLSVKYHSIRPVSVDLTFLKGSSVNRNFVLLRFNEWCMIKRLIHVWAQNMCNEFSIKKHLRSGRKKLYRVIQTMLSCPAFQDHCVSRILENISVVNSLCHWYATTVLETHTFYRCVLMSCLPGPCVLCEIIGNWSTIAVVSSTPIIHYMYHFAFTMFTSLWINTLEWLLIVLRKSAQNIKKEPHINFNRGSIKDSHVGEKWYLIVDKRTNESYMFLLSAWPN